MQINMPHVIDKIMITNFDIGLPFYTPTFGVVGNGFRRIKAIQSRQIARRYRPGTRLSKINFGPFFQGSRSVARRGVTGSDTLAGQATADLVVSKDFSVDPRTPKAPGPGDWPRFRRGSTAGTSPPPSTSRRGSMPAGGGRSSRRPWPSAAGPRPCQLPRSPADRPPTTRDRAWRCWLGTGRGAPPGIRAEAAQALAARDVISEGTARDLSCVQPSVMAGRGSGSVVV